MDNWCKKLTRLDLVNMLPTSAFCGNLVAWRAAHFHCFTSAPSIGIGNAGTSSDPDIDRTAKISSLSFDPQPSMTSWKSKLESSQMWLLHWGPCHRHIIEILARASLLAQYIDWSSFLHDAELHGPSHRKMKLSASFAPGMWDKLFLKCSHIFRNPAAGF